MLMTVLLSDYKIHFFGFNQAIFQQSELLLVILKETNPIFRIVFIKTVHKRICRDVMSPINGLLRFVKGNNR